jgi:hypothetical protein
VGLHLLYDLAKAVGVRPLDLLPADGAGVDGVGSLDEVLVGTRGTVRAKVERDIRGLSEENRERVLRLVSRKVVKDGGSGES